MAKTKTSIDSIKVVQPELVRPGSRVTIALQFQHELREGEYAIDFEPPGLVIDPETQTAFCEITGRSLKIESGHSVKKLELEFEVPRETHLFGPQTLRVAVNRDQPPVSESASAAVVIEAPRQVEVTEFPVVVSRKDTVPSNYTRNIILHKQIKSGTDAMKFPEFKRHLDLLLCGEYKGQLPPEWIGGFASELLKRRFLPFSDTEAYRVLKVATEAFVLLKCQTAGPPLTHAEFNEAIKGEAERIGAVHVPDDPLQDFQDNYLQGGLLPYLRLVFDRLGDSRLKDSIFPGYNPDAFIANPQITGCIGALKEKLRAPILIELIWSYWHEQAMQVQTMFAIRNRFQNISSAPGGDPLAGMEIGALRPLNNLLWGYIQDEQHRLTLTRRNYEYEHHYGLSLRGKAVAAIQPADRRSKFLEAFHNLLYLASIFFKEDDDTNRRADAFPVLHALKEVHFLLSEGAHNQFGDLPTTSRIEMLMEQWLMSRPEFREFLPTRESIAYPEEWMGTVDAMKSVQGWTSTSVMFFNDLARFGEQLLLSIRYDHWSEVVDRNEAANWAKIWRSEIQGYIHAFRIVTGVDLSIEPAGLAAEERRRDPSLLIQQRWEEQKRAGLARPAIARLPASPSAGAWAQPKRLAVKR